MVVYLPRAVLHAEVRKFMITISHLLEARFMCSFFFGSTSDGLNHSGFSDDFCGVEDRNGLRGNRWSGGRVPYVIEGAFSK